MKKFFLLLVLTLGLGLMTIQAQIGFAVAKNDDYSAVRWRVSWGEDSYYSCERDAKDRLKDEGYDNVYGQSSRNAGCETKSGYYIVIEGKHKFSDGKRKSGFGFGASSNSMEEAKERAKKNLATNFWSWTKSDGYTVVKRGTF